MKTQTKLRLPPPPSPEGIDSIDLKAFFCGCALQGVLANQEGSEYADDYLVERACQMGARMYDLYLEENPSVISKFDRKVGV